MTHHLLPEMDLDWVPAFRNVLLVRDPAEVVASYVRSRESCEPEDIGLLQQARLLEVLPPDTPVVDAGDFLRAPEAHLRWLCDWLGIDFTERMLTWPAGPRDSDGVWAPHWYAAVEASTGFEPWRARSVELDDHDAAVAEACRPAYDLLHARRLRL
ncbi:MAG: family hydrolase, partial [Marmoricola sp.]|nr:family hydrolase [Marmoricola sp.]